MSENQPQIEERETGRVEAFSDGVFAIAITLLVLEVRVPHLSGEGGGAGLTALLLEQWPSYLAYVLSFLVIGVMWINHHNMFRYIRRVDNAFMFFNALLLLAICLVNFTTTLLAEYITEPGAAEVAGIAYAGMGFIIAIFYNLMWLYAIGSDRLVNPAIDGDHIKVITRQYRFGPVLYLVALLLVFVSIWLSLALQFGLAVFFALTDSTRSPVRAVNPQPGQSG